MDNPQPSTIFITSDSSLAFDYQSATLSLSFGGESQIPDRAPKTTNDFTTCLLITDPSKPGRSIVVSPRSTRLHSTIEKLSRAKNVRKYPRKPPLPNKCLLQIGRNWNQSSFTVIIVACLGIKSLYASILREVTRPMLNPSGRKKDHVEKKRDF